MISKKYLFGLLLFMIIGCFSVVIYSKGNPLKDNLFDQKSSIINLPDEALGPFAWKGRSFYQVSEEKFKSVLEKKDPLSIFFYTFSLMRFESESGNPEAGAMARRLLDHMINAYEPADRSDAGIHWKYGFEYSNLKSGWWSGMDAFLGPLAFYAAYQQYGNEEYKEVALKSAKLALRSPSDGGVIWRTEEGCWVSEYTWPGMSWGDEYQVLNGHLYGLQALYMLAVLEDDSELMSTYECAYAKSMSSQDFFYGNDRKWSWYSLVPKDINPVHYLLFEAIQYNALHKLTGDAGWSTGFAARSKIFENAYRPEVLETADGQYKVLLGMLGAPHPYWPDTYPLKLTCKAEGKAYSAYNDKQYQSQLPMVDRFFIELDVPSKPESCTVHVDAFPNFLFPIYETSEFRVVSIEKKKVLKEKIDAMLNASTSDNEGMIAVDHALGAVEGRVYLTVNQNLGIEDTVALVVKSDMDTHLGVLLEDVDGNVARREYNPVSAGKPNLILLNKYGFDGQEDLGETIKSLALRLYADDAKSKFKFSIVDFKVLSGANELKNFLSDVGDVEFSIQ